MPTITFFEQSAFTIEHQGKTLAVDFGSYATAEDLASLQPITASLVTHIHPDHFSEDNLQTLGRPVYTVSEVDQAIMDKNLEIHVLATNQSVQIPDTEFTVLATPSEHGPNVSKPVENVGFLISTPDFAVYYLGDMAVSTPPPSQKYDLVLVPVGNNGYTFDPAEAVAHLKSIDWKGLTIPIHYQNSSGRFDPEAGQKFSKLAKNDFQVKVVKIGESLSL